MEEEAVLSSRADSAREHDAVEDTQAKLAEEEEQLFTSWSSNTVSSILFDVRRFEGVFDQILKQLDYLRRRQSHVMSSLESMGGNVSRLNDSVEVINSIVDRNGVYRSRRASMMGMGSSFMIPESAEPSNQPAAPSVDVSGIQTELQELRSDFDELRNAFHNNHALENRFKALEHWIQVELKDHEKRMDALLLQLNEQRGQSIALQNRVESLERGFQDRLNALRKEFEEKLQSVEYGHVQLAKDIDLKTHALRDTLSVHDLRAKSIDTKVHNLTEQQQALREALESLPATYFDQIYQSINELYADKANKRELDTKADVSLAYQKADASEIDRLQGITDELQRRLIALLAETTDKVAQMDAKLDRRSDRIVQYCLKQLKKDMKTMNLNGGEERAAELTDIGKVRCLVCNHVSVQQRDQDIVHSGHERLTHTLKTLRPRSASPPPSPEPGTDSPQRRSRPQTAGGAASRPATAGGATGGNGGNGGDFAMPEVNYAGQETEDPDYIADFRFRAPVSSTGQHDRVKLPAVVTTNTNPQTHTTTKSLAQFVTNTTNTQSAPMIQIISHHIPLDSAKGAGSVPLGSAGQQPSPGAFRDLEQRLHPYLNTVTTPAMGNPTTVVATGNKRPMQSHGAAILSSTSSAAQQKALLQQQQQGGSAARPKSAPPKRT